MLAYTSIAELTEAAQAQNKTISEIVIADQAADMESTPEALYEKMDRSFQVMIEAVQYGQKKIKNRCRA